MKINPNIASGLYEAFRKNGSGRAQPGASASLSGDRGDKVEISDEAQRMQSIRAQLANLPPDARTERIEALRQQVQGGTYRADVRALAEKLAQSGIMGPYGK